MEGGDWTSFSGVCVNEEADFMAQLFPNPSFANDIGISYNHESNFCVDGGSFYSCEATNSSNNFSSYSFSQDSSYNTDQEGYYLSHCHQVLGASNSSLPFDFLQCHMHGNDGLNAEMNGANLEDSPIDQAIEDKSSDSSDTMKKRSRVSDVQKGKRNVKARRGQKQEISGNEEEGDNNVGGLNMQSSSCSSLEDDCSSKGTAALNSNGKTRASRGSATDPQSLYARKRRERINERLRILQSLVPNGTKVDISTMLEEAVHYVKFLQLQIKMLSSDELWMYAPLAYNGMNLGLDLKINMP